MNKQRLVFSKSGAAAYISHLDLMRTFQRAFIRSGLRVWHTEGFNPHAYVAIALPMPVAHESCCELLDFGFEDGVTEENVVQRMNEALPSGIVVTDCYENGRPLKQLKYVDNEIVLEYDSGVPEGTVEKIKQVFALPELLIMKKAKKGGMKELDIKPLIRRLEIEEQEKTVRIRAVLEAMNPYLNPVYVLSAIEKYAPEAAPDFATYKRLAVLDEKLKNFR